MALNLIVYLLIVPLIITTKMDFMRLAKFIWDLLFVADIFINMNTGYQVYDRKEVIMSKRDIRRNYLFGYFFLDFFTSVPVDFPFYLSGRPLMWPLIIPALKLLKLGQLFRTMTFFCDVSNQTFVSRLKLNIF